MKGHINSGGFQIPYSFYDQKPKKKFAKNQANAAFYVGSMFDQAGQYMAKCNAWTGEITGHVDLNAPASEDIFEDYEEEAEIQPINQLKLF